MRSLLKGTANLGRRARMAVVLASVSALVVCQMALAGVAHAELGDGVAKEVTEKTESKLETAAPFIIGLFVAVLIFGAILAWTKRHTKSSVRS